MSAPTDDVAVITELARRFMSGDGAGAVALFHPEIRVQQPETLPHGGWHTGHAGVAAMGTEFGKHWTRTITEPRIYGADELVMQLTTQTWTGKESGRSATVDVVELFTVTDGLVTELRVFQHDTHLLMGLL